ncbi:MAG: hypothetical protein ACI8VC_001917 [Candidatus Endobugula sp.]|jgi:hypothetical protein
MTIETWDPSKPENDNDGYVIDETFLQRIIDFMTIETPGNVRSFITLEEQQYHQPIMLQPKEEWLARRLLFSTDDIIALIKFFTLAEMQYNHWRAEEHSPVIWLTQVLRQKEGKIDKNLLLWIKKESDNKFLPNGAL